MKALNNDLIGIGVVQSKPEKRLERTVSPLRRQVDKSNNK